MASFGINHAAGPGGSTFVIPKLRQPAEERERSGADDVKSHGGSGRGHDRKDAATNSTTNNTSTAPATVRNAARLNVWTGALRFKEETVESVDLYSPFRDCAKPPGFSSSLDVKLLITSADCQKYAPIVELLNSRTSSVLLRRARVFLCLPQSSSSSTTARSTPMQASYLYLTNTFSPLFARIYERLKAKEIVAMSVLADDTVLLLLPEGKLTERLGIPAHDKPVFHCIFLRPRPDISDEVYRRGLLAMDHIPAEPTPHDKLDGGDESVLVAVDKYRRTCGLPTVKRIAPTPMNSLLSPGKTPPGGKPPTPYIPTPGSSGYMPGKAAEKHRNTYGYHSPQNGQDWHSVHDILKPPPPPPPQLSSAEYGVGGVHTPRGILNHGTGGGGLARHPDIVRSPGTEARRAKNQSLFKNALEQMRKINESKSTATASGSPERFQPIIPPLKTPSPAFVPPPPPPPLLATPPDTEQPLPPPPPAPTVPPAILRDPRLHKHGYVVDKPKQQQTTLAAQQHKTNEIPFDVRQNSTQSPPSDPRLKRVSGAAAPSSTVSTPPSFSNLGFKRAYGGIAGGGVLRNAPADEPEEKKMLPVVKKPPPSPLQQHTIETVDDTTQLQQQQHHQIGQQPPAAAIVCIDETTITECVPMEIDGDDEDSRPYSPSQATPPPSPMEVEKTEKGEEAGKEKLDEYYGNGKEKMDEGEKMGTMESEEEQMHVSGHKSPEPTGLERPEQVGIQSPISLVRSIISSPSPKTPPKSERRAKVPPSSASLNASGFGFDFLNWNNSDSPSKEMQSSSSSSSYSSGGLKVDESFNVEELLKQAVVHKSVAEEQPNDFRALVQLKKKENNNVAASPESAENNAPPVPSTVPSLPAKPLAQCLSQPPPQPPPLMAVTITPPPVPPSLVPLSVTNGTGGVHLRPPSMAPSRFVPPTIPPPLQRPSPVAFSRPTVANSSVRLLHRLDVPPPVLHMPPPPLIRAAGPKNSKMMSTTCKSVVLLDPEAIMCCRIQLNELRAVFAAATRNSVLVLWHQMITAKLIEVGVDAKPYLALADEYVAVGTLERMEAHLCDKSGLDLHKLMACTVGVAREQRSRKPEMRVLFLSAMIGAGSDEASDFVANQIEVVSAAQFVEQFK
uniref:Uncharacterized protein n=1 Tax=Globodera rostochiensis TaxID=31243 RepID=A0A914GXU6_GLORO